MERRILTAFILSSIVLFTWSVIFPRSKVKEMSNQMQLLENKEDIKVIDMVGATAIPPVAFEPETTTDNVQEESKTLENSHLLAEFSSKGGALTKVTIKPYDVTLPVTGILVLSDYVDQAFKLESIDTNSIVYVYQTPEGGKVRKSYTLSEDDYTLRAEVELQNLKKEDIKMAAFLLDIDRLDITKTDHHDQSLFEYFVISPQGNQRKAGASKFSQKEAKSYAEPVELVGFRDHYFSMILKPDFKTEIGR